MKYFLIVLISLVANGAIAFSNTQRVVPTGSPGLRLPILFDRDAPHPRNKNLQGEALLQWMDHERNHLLNKYSKHTGKGEAKLDKRQTAPLGNMVKSGRYYAQVGIGTPKELYNIMLDSGSADFWVETPPCTGCTVKLFDPSKSSTYQPSNRSSRIGYLGADQGTMAADNVSLANYKVAGLNFGVVPAKNNDTSLTSGIMGLAFESLSDNHVTPFWQIVAAEGKVQDPVFSFELKVNTNISQANEMVSGGVFTLGTLDHQQYSGEITWMDLDSRYGSKGKGFWGVKMDALSVNGSDVPLGSNDLVLVDTGSSIIGAPPEVAKAFHEQIPNSTLASSAIGEKQDDDFATYYVYPCSEQFEVAFTFGGRAFTLNQDQINIGTFNKTTSSCVSGFASVTYPTDNQTNAWILGSLFLSEVFSVFSWEPQRVGFASLPANGPKTLALSSTQSHPASSGAAASSSGFSQSDAHSRSLPTPTLAEMPSGMSKLSVASSLPSGTASGSGSGNGAPNQTGRTSFVQTTLLAMALVVCLLVS